MTRRIHLLRIRQSYADGLVLHTATSGAVPVLDELRLVVEEDGSLAALGATRLNIAYLTGIEPGALLDCCVAAFDCIDWSLDWTTMSGRLDDAMPDLPAPVRMLFEMAAADGAARRAGRSLAEWLGAVGVAEAVPTNQTLFLCDDETMLRRAAAYAARGFMDLKLRVGAGEPHQDLRRLRLLRARFGPGLLLSADANGAWSTVTAPAILAQLAKLGLAYVEQPVPAGDWDGIARLASEVALPIMLDESLCDMAAVDTLVRTRAAPLAHLKLAKLGGLDRMMLAGRALRAAGIGVMVGQMNEGTVSTLAAAHAAAALGARFHELYGADGLIADPAGPLRYAEGRVHLPAGPGLGLQRHDLAGPILREHIA